MFLKVRFLFYLSLVALATALPAAADQAGQQPIASLKVLDLATAQDIAVSGNPSIQAVQDRIEQAQQQVRQKEAAWFPSLDATTSLTHTEDAANATLSNEGDTYDASLSATLTLFDGFSRSYNLKSARYGETASVAAEKDARRLLIFNVAQSYYTLQSAEENISIALSDKAYNARQLKEAEARHKAGAGSLSDVLNFKIKVNTAAATLLTAEKNHAVALTGLAALMGIDEAALPEDLTLAPLETKGAWDTAPLVTEDLITTALTLRPDLAQSDSTVKQAESAVGIARSGYYPTVSLTGALSGSREDDARYEGDDFGSSIGVTVKLNLFSGGETRAKVTEAEAARREARHTMEDVALTVKKEVREAVEEIDTAFRQVKLQEETVALTRQSRDLVEEEYRAGKTGVVKLNEAQNNLVSAEGGLVDARVSLLTAWEKIRSVTGTNLTR